MTGTIRLYAGELRDRCLLESRTGAQIASGEVTDAWSTVGNYWGKLEAASPRTAAMAAGISVTAAYTLTLRYNASVTNDCRFTIGGTVYQISGVIHDPRKVWTMAFVERLMS